MQQASQPPFGTFSLPPVASGLLWLSRRSFLGRGKWRQWVYSAIRSMHDKPVDTTFWGVPIRIDPRTNLVERKPMLRLDRTDVKERKIMHAALSKAGSVLVDIGANMGLYSFDAVINGPENVRVVAIDPQPPMIDRFTFNLANMREEKVRGVDNIQFFPVAVGREEGTLRFTNDGPEHMGHVVEEGGIEVPVRTLLDILDEAKIDRIDCLKIDIEGHEGDALGPFLREAPDNLVPECVLIEYCTHGHWSEDIFALMKQRGMEEVERFNLNAVWKKTQTNENR